MSESVNVTNSKNDSVNAAEQSTSRTLKGYLGLAARGFAMGAADVVPGVSGGTMAFILGIYEELINSIRDLINPETIKLFLSFRIKEAVDRIAWKFLFALSFGILLAIFSLAPLLEAMLVNYPSLLWAFFFGLVAASIFTVVKRVKQWNTWTIGGAIIGTVAAYYIVGLVPVETPDAAWFLFLSGFIAICAMILPGISGSFILVLLGKYQQILAAVNDRDFVTLFLVAAGAFVGIVSFAQVLGWLFKRYHDMTVAILIGLMVGSLRKVWPWKETIRTILDRHGEPIPVEQINVLPPVWTTEVTLALALAIVGFVLVFVLDYWAASTEQSQLQTSYSEAG